MLSDDPYVVAHVEVEAVERISPSFMRVTLGGRDLDTVGTPGNTFDQRIKVIIPRDQDTFRRIPRDTSDWYSDWLALPEATRGDMRTYSIRHLCVQGTTTRLTLDIVRHGITANERQGPGARWACHAKPGDRLSVVAPRRAHPGAAIEFQRDARAVLLAGDESALPAMARILEDAPRDLTGAAFIEIPHAADRQRIDAPSGVSLTWLVRGSAPHGSALVGALLAGADRSPQAMEAGAGGDDLVWETPGCSGLGERVREDRGSCDCFYWIAGESSMVKAIRRHFVVQMGIERSSVAFMGYWRAA